MRGKRATRRSCSYDRAKMSAQDAEIVAQIKADDFMRGSYWAAIAIALTFGPMLALGIFWGWV